MRHLLNSRAMFALAMLWNSAACAQSPSGPWPQPTDVMVVTASRVGGPRGVQQPPPRPSQSSCDKSLPTGRTISPDTKPTLFWYRLTPDGTIHDTSLYRSSGDSDLDKAALACADGEHIRPQLVTGTPAEIVWVGGINWPSAAHLFFVPAPDGTPAANCRLSYPSSAISRNQQGVADIGYRVGTDGIPKDATVVRSSDSSSLDAAALGCVQSFRFLPAYHNKQLVEIDRLARIAWQIVVRGQQ